MLSYAGITLPVWTAEAATWVEANLTLADVLEFSHLDWPGFRYWMGCASLGTMARRRISAGRLFWPRGAQRFSTFHGIVDDATLAAIRAATESSTYTAQPLILTWVDASTQVEVARISPSMYLLPARPLAQIAGFNGMNLLTLVDQRYFWWYANTGALTITEGTTAWTDLYSTLGAQLGVVITPDAIPAAYLKPSASLAVPYDYVPVLLDAVAYNVGQRITRDLAGNVRARNPVNAAADVAANRAMPNVLRQAGGVFLFPTALPSDSPGVLPASVTVAFPRTDDGAFANTYTAENVTLISLALADLPPATVTNSGTKTFHDTAPAAYTTGSPTNAAEVLALAQQIATDWYRFQVAPLDVKYCGILPWSPDALHDSVEWSYKAMDGPQGEGDCCTRIIRPPFNDLTEDLAHGGGTGGTSIGPVGPPTGGGGGTSPLPPIYPPVMDPTGGGGGTIPLPPKTAKLLFTPAGSESINGFTGAVSGQLLCLINLGPGKVTLKNNAIGLGGILPPIPFDYVLQPKDEVQLEFIGLTNKWYFATPTIGAGTTPEYGCQQLLPGVNVTITPNGDGTANINSNAGVFPTTAGSVNLTNNFTATLVFTNVTGLTTGALPAGVYACVADIQGVQNLFSTTDVLLVQYAVAGVAINNTIRMVVWGFNTNTGQWLGSCSLSQVINLPAGGTITVQAQASQVAPNGSGVILGGVGFPWTSSLSWLRIG